MAEAKTTDKSKTDTKTDANRRQEEAEKAQREDAEKSARRAKSIDSGTVTVVLRDEADSTIDAVRRLAVEHGGVVKSSRGSKMTVELPEGSERQTDSQRQKIVEHLLGSPLVEDVE